MFTNTDGTPNKDIDALWRTTTDENGNTHREIVYNPYVDGDINEQKTMQQVTIHEMLHDMAGDKQVRNDLFKLVLDKNKTRDGYSDARSNLEEMYSQVYDKSSKDFKDLVDEEEVADTLAQKLGDQDFINSLNKEKPNVFKYSQVYDKSSKDFKDLVDEEEVADTLAQKLGDQDFINSLNKEKPNVFKRIYNWVVDKLNKFTGSKNEKLYWEDVKNKFENAYRQDYQENRNIQNKYSFVGEKGLNNAIYQDSGYIQVERGLNRAKQMREKGIDNETIRQTTGWFQDKNKDWKFEISDKNMKLKDNIKLKENTSYKLGDVIEHDNLFVMYPELKNYKVSFEDISTSGKIKLSNNEIKINNKSIKSKTKVEGTLIHEIQHAIQNIENFEGGRTSKRSKLAYYRSLGEIEASDTKTRFLNEKYKNKKIYNIPPESSKSQPRHKPSIKQSGAWQSFLENQIGSSGKGKTVQELRLPTKENWDIVKSQNKIKQNNKAILKDIGITENNDLITNSNDEDVGEENIAQVL